MSNDDSWSGADKIPPMVYVPPPDADAPAGRGGVIGLIVLLFTIVAIVVAGFFSLQNWVYSRSLANPANWSTFELDGGLYGLLKAERAITADSDAASMERYRTDLFAQNREMCANLLRAPAVLALPDLERQIDDNRRLYDTACQNAGRTATCTKTSQDAPAAITAEQRTALCALYPARVPTTTQPQQQPQQR